MAGGGGEICETTGANRLILSCLETDLLLSFTSLEEQKEFRKFNSARHCQPFLPRKKSFLATAAVPDTRTWICFLNGHHMLPPINQRFGNTQQETCASASGLRATLAEQKPHQSPPSIT